MKYHIADGEGYRIASFEKREHRDICLERLLEVLETEWPEEHSDEFYRPQESADVVYYDNGQPQSQREDDDF